MNNNNINNNVMITSYLLHLLVFLVCLQCIITTTYTSAKILRRSLSAAAAVIASSQLNTAVATTTTTESRLLTTTVRNDYGLESDGSMTDRKPQLLQLWKSRLAESLNNNNEDLKLQFSSIIKSLNNNNVNVVVGLVLSVLWLEAANSAGDYRHLFDESNSTSTALSIRLGEAQKALDNLTRDNNDELAEARRVEEQLRQQVESLVQRISSQDVDIDGLTASLQRLSDELKTNKPVVPTPPPPVDSSSVLDRLQSKVLQLEKDRQVSLQREKKALESLKSCCCWRGVE